MTWAFAVGRRAAFPWLRRAGFAGALLLGALAGCSAGSPTPAADDSSGGTSSTAGDSSSAGASGTAGSGATSGAGATAGVGGGSAGSGGSVPGLTITQAGNCGVYSMDFGATHVEVDPTQGGRISALRTGSVAVLADANVTGTTVNWGSTFWPSPQSWSWPPSGSIGAIDPNPYTCPASDAASFTVLSAANTGSGPTISVSKKFSADVAKEALIIDYTMTNTGSAAIMVAPWEISRIPPGSLSFYPGTAPATRTGAPAPLPTTTTDASGVVWYQQALNSANRYKLYDDGKGGWLATTVNGVVLVKQFTDVPAAQQFATEAEIELYSNGVTAAGKGYVEMEQQGPMQSLAAGASLTWTVRWYARPLPSGATAAVGDATLLAFVKSLVQ